MSLQQLSDLLPAYAKDIKLNLSSLFNNAETDGLTQQQLLGTALAVAYATKNQLLIKCIEDESQAILDDNYIVAAKAAASIMAMNNIYYRFVHSVRDQEYSSMPVKLRMNIIANSGIEKTDFEMFSLAVSAINGCGLCMDAHAKVLEKQGLSKTAIQTIIRLAAVVNAAAQALAIQ